VVEVDVSSLQVGNGENRVHGDLSELVLVLADYLAT
jgi:hypothetical protein